MNTKNEYITRILSVCVLPKNDPIFSEMATKITIDDEASGEYLEIQQESGSTSRKDNSILINPEEWPELRSAIDMMVKEIEKHEITKP